MPAHPAAGAPPVYAPPPPDQRFDRGAPPPYPPGYDPYGHQGPHAPQSRDRAAEAAEFARRHIRTPETKEFFKTSEFGVWIFMLVLMFIAAATSDAFNGGRLWLYATIVSAAYIVSRGIAKAGSSRGKPESHWGHDHQA